MPNWRKVVVSGSAPTLSGLTVKGPLEVSMTASSGTIPLSILAASDSSDDVLIKVRDDGESYDLMTFDSEGRFNMRGTSTDSEGAGYYVSQGGVVKEHAKMGFVNGKAQLSLSTNSADRFKVWLNSSNTSPMVGLEGRGTLALGTSVSAGSLPNEARTNTMFIKTGTAPSTAEADNIQFFAQDVNSVAGTASPTFLTEDGTTIQLGVTSSLDHVEATTFVKSGGTSTQFLKADGSVDSTTYYSVASTIQATAGSAASPAYTFFTDQNSGFFKSGNDVIGASAGGSKVLDISSEGITVYGDIVKNGGTSAQFLKADGSVDSTTYLSSLTGAVLTTGDQTASGTKTFSGTVKISNAVNAGFDTNKFLVLDTTDKIDFRTGAEVRADIDAAADGANSDITSLSGLTTALSVGQGGTGLTTLSSGEVPYGNGTSALNTNGAFVFDQSVKQLQLTGDSSNAPLKLTNVQANAEETKVGLILNSTNDGVEKATLGSNAFNSTNFLTSLSGAVLTSGNQSAAGTKTFTGQIVIGANGSISAPMIRFPGSSTNTGFYSSNPDEISITIGGTQKVIFNSGTSEFKSHLRAHCLGVGGAAPGTSGEIWAYGDVVANYSSDKRLKKNIKPISSALDKLLQISGVEFDWIEKKEVHSHKGHDVGVIAQEIEEVLPEVVATRDNGYKAVNYEKIVPLLIEAIKDLKAEVDELKKSK